MHDNLQQAFDEMRVKIKGLGFKIASKHLDRVYGQVVAFEGDVYEYYELNGKFLLHVESNHKRVAITLWGGPKLIDLKTSVKIQTDVGMFLKELEAC